MRMSASQRGLAGLVLGGALIGVIVWATLAPAASAQGSNAVVRGRHLVESMGCHDCHTPWKMGPNGPEPDTSRELQGHPADIKLPPPPASSGPWVMAITADMTAWAGPWGISYTRNLTPHKENGLGEWTEQQFIDTLRTGRRQGRGRELLPPMPWQAYGKASDEDLKAIFAYLKSLPPSANKVPEPVIAAPPGK